MSGMDRDERSATLANEISELRTRVAVLRGEMAVTKVLVIISLVAWVIAGLHAVFR